MLDHPWVRLLLGALVAALLGAMAARVAVSAGSGAGDGGAAAGAARGPDGGSGATRDAASGGSSGAGGSAGAGATATLAGGSGRVTVHVTGEVRRPGVYALREGARVNDAVRRAGGATGAGDRQALNLAATVRDGQQVRVPPRAVAGNGGSAAGGQATGGEAAGPAAGAGGPAGPIDLNTASPEELQALDGVGAATAAKIVQFREQRGGIGGVDDLGEIPGIGAKKLEALRAQLEP